MQQHPNYPAWAFLVQAINDFAATLPPSARAAFEAVAQQHVQALTPAVLGPVTKGDETSAEPAQTPPAA